MAEVVMLKGETLLKESKEESLRNQLQKQGGEWMEFTAPERKVMQMTLTVDGGVLLYIRTRKEMVNRITNKRKTLETYQHTQKQHAIEGRKLVAAFRQEIYEKQHRRAAMQNEQQQQQQQQQEGEKINK